MPTSFQTIRRPRTLLQISANIWFATVVIGQFVFALYILGVYGVNGLAGDFERWNTATPHGYISGDLGGNLIFGMHVLFAAVITLGGPLQLLRSVRSRFPKFHRINGRIYLLAAFCITMAGFYLTWVRGNVGGLEGAIFISINGFCILLGAFFTIQKARARQMEAHREWAIRFYLAMSGVWFVRVTLMLWLTIHQEPVGFDPETFQGPAINMINVICYVLPVPCVQVYFWIKKEGSVTAKRILAILVLGMTCGIAVGTIAATLGMWLPSL